MTSTLKRTPIILFLLFLSFTLTGCGEKIKVDPQNTTVKGKKYTITGKVAKHHDLYINERSVSLERDKTFSYNVSLKEGKNKFTLTASPKSRDKDNYELDLYITRQLYPAEVEFKKISNTKTIQSSRSIDFAIDPKGIYLASVYGPDHILISNLQEGSEKRIPNSDGCNCEWRPLTFTYDGKYLLAAADGRSNFQRFSRDNWELKGITWTNGSSKIATGFNPKKNKEYIVTSCNGIWASSPSNFKEYGCYFPWWSSNDIVLSPDASILAIVYDRKIVLTDPASPYVKKKFSLSDREEKNIEEGFSSKSTSIYINGMSRNEEIESIIFSSNKEIIVGTSNGQIKIITIDDKLNATVKKETKLAKGVHTLSLSKEKGILISSGNGITFLNYPDLTTITRLSGFSTRKVQVDVAGISYYFLKYMPGNYLTVCRGNLDFDPKLIKEYNKLLQQGVI